MGKKDVPLTHVSVNSNEFFLLGPSALVYLRAVHVHDLVNYRLWKVLHRFISLESPAFSMAYRYSDFEIGLGIGSRHWYVFLVTCLSFFTFPSPSQKTNWKFRPKGFWQRANSSIRLIISQTSLKTLNIVKWTMSGKQIELFPTRWQWNKEAKAPNLDW